ncbi:hypothetical protein T261_6857 [Streptomyces lydicus]|nr:hypothetical protein T261_6857 [Streptomyces lydicus]
MQILEQRQGVRIGCVEEIAYRMGYISWEECHRLGSEQAGTEYGAYLIGLAEGAAASHHVAAETAALLRTA